MNREDGLSIDMVIHMMTVYFDVLDLKMEKGVPLSKAINQEKNNGRWEHIVSVVVMLRRIFNKIVIIDSIEEYLAEISDDLRALMRRFDMYAILFSEE